MMANQGIKLLISDLDGTLVDTYQANFHAYRQAFAEVGLSLSPEDYARCYGLRFDRFMQKIGIEEIVISEKIRRLKELYYPEFFRFLHPNSVLLQFIRDFHQKDGWTAVASTSRRINLMRVLHAIGAVNDFDLILSGEDVLEGKPSPEIYLKVLEYFRLSPLQALVFEDSEVGLEAAERCGIPFIKIKM